jgi:hypothetical protein
MLEMKTPRTVGACPRVCATAQRLIRLLPFLKAKPERPKTGADRCSAYAGSPILVCPISAPVTKHPELACPLATGDKCGDDRSG